MKKYQISILDRENKETLKLDVEYENLSKLFIALSLELPRIIEDGDSIRIKEIK